MNRGQTYGEQVLQITQDDRFLSIAKLFFAFGLGNSLTFPLSVGAMASFKRPRRIVVVDSLPNTATGKIKRYALRQTLGS